MLFLLVSMAISIGSFTLRNNVALAPMSGVTDVPFRLAAWRAGAGYVVSEMVASQELAKARPDVVRRAEGHPEVSPFVVQLAGREPQWMSEGARLAEAAGADIVDINMGCPSRQVTGALSGSALMRDLDLAESLIRATISGTSKPVTLKMRLGWDHSMLNAPELAKRAEDAGVKLITVHGRTRNQFYKGTADWHAVAATRQATSLPLIVNGDIVDLNTARAALNASGADGVMIGRASVGKAWLPGAIADALMSGADLILEPSIEAQTSSFFEHYQDIIDHYPDGLGVRMARKHLAAFIDEAPLDVPQKARREARALLCQLTSSLEVIEELREFLLKGYVSHRVAA
ncbi:MAG: tRNA dihydrouridine synthase DusB [Pseudomonadota bacterium]